MQLQIFHAKRWLFCVGLNVLNHTKSFKGMDLEHNVIFAIHWLKIWYDLDCILATVKPVYNDHLYNEIYYMWFIQ